MTMALWMAQRCWDAAPAGLTSCVIHIIMLDTSNLHSAGRCWKKKIKWKKEMCLEVKK